MGLNEALGGRIIQLLSLWSAQMSQCPDVGTNGYIRASQVIHAASMTGISRTIGSLFPFVGYNEHQSRYGCVWSGSVNAKVVLSKATLTL